VNSAPALAAIALLGAAPSAPPSMAQVLQASYAVRDLGNVELSSDGSAVVYREAIESAEPATVVVRRSRVFVQRLGQAPVRITAGDGGDFNETEPRWSPDGRNIAFLSDARTRGQLQLYVCDAQGRGPRRAGTLAGNVQGLRWAPDGRSVSVLYIASAHRQAGALAPGARDVGVIGSVVDEQRIALVDVATGSMRPITPPDDYVYEYDWAPDGRRIAFTYARGNGDNNWWIAKLATIGSDGAGMRDVLAPHFQIDAPRWSPDGRKIALIGGLMSDFGATGGDLYVVDPGTGAARDVTPSDALSVQSLQWIAPNRIDFVAHVRGAMHLMRLDLDGGSPAPLTDRPESVLSWSAARGGGVVAIVRQSFDDPPEVWAGPPSALTALTNVNAGATRYWGKARSLEWKSDPYTVQGWLIYPLDFDPNRTYPMVTIVHGGPSSQSVPVYGNRTIAALSSRGYFVFEPNPRGSYGAGEAYTAANVKDFGYGDWRDDLAGIDAAIAAAPIDGQRLGLYGWSYGGYMAMWAETQTDRFKAIVGGAGIVNWQSYYGQNKIDQWMIPFFGASVYDDPAVYAKSSPITFVKRSKTPVLILQGEYDEEVPAPQAFEFYNAMQALGVPSRLVVYADEGHSPQKTADQIDILTRIVGWFDRYLK